MLVHSYFEKLMKTPYVLMCNSAMSEHQKYSILSNEIIRRLSNIDHQNVGIDTVEKVLETMITQMKTSGYSRKETREAIVSGVIGWKRKIKRRQQEGLDFYRSAQSTLKTRCKKKLLEKTSW